MASFPFHRLSHLAQLEIIRNSEFPEIFRLATISKKLKKIIQTANIALLNFKLEINEDSVTLDFQFPKTERKFQIKIDTDFKEECMGNNRLFTTESTLPNRWFLDTRVRKREFVGLVAEFLSSLMKLFKGTELYLLVLRPSDVTDRLMRKVIKPHFSTVQHLHLIEMNSYEWVKEEQFRQMFENITVIKRLNISCQVETKVPYRCQFESELVKVINPSWIHVDDIINSTTKKFQFEEEPPSSGFMNAILKAWISKTKLINLECVTWEADWEDGFGDEVMESIEKAVLEQEEENQETRLDEEEELDFECFFRRIDGKLAVVKMNSTMFQFRVC